MRPSALACERSYILVQLLELKVSAHSSVGFKRRVLGGMLNGTTCGLRKKLCGREEASCNHFRENVLSLQAMGRKANFLWVVCF